MAWMCHVGHKKINSSSFGFFWDLSRLEFQSQAIISKGNNLIIAILGTVFAIWPPCLQNFWAGLTKIHHPKKTHWLIGLEFLSLFKRDTIFTSKGNKTLLGYLSFPWRPASGIFRIHKQNPPTYICRAPEGRWGWGWWHRCKVKNVFLE